MSYFEQGGVKFFRHVLSFLLDQQKGLLHLTGTMKVYVTSEFALNVKYMPKLGHKSDNIFMKLNVA